MATGAVTPVAVSSESFIDMAVLPTLDGLDDEYLLLVASTSTGVRTVNLKTGTSSRTVSPTFAVRVPLDSDSFLLPASVAFSSVAGNSATGDLYVSTSEGVYFVSNAQLRGALANGTVALARELTIRGASVEYESTSEQGQLKSIRFDKQNNLVGIDAEGNFVQINALAAGANVTQILATEPSTVAQTCGPLPAAGAIPSAPSSRSAVSWRLTIKGDCSAAQDNVNGGADPDILDQLGADLVTALGVDRLQVDVSLLVCARGGDTYNVGGNFPNWPVGTNEDPAALATRLETMVTNKDGALFSNDRTISKNIVQGSYSEGTCDVFDCSASAIGSSFAVTVALIAAAFALKF